MVQGTTVGTVMLLCLLPVGTMITGSIIVTFFQPGPKLTSAMQHFAAGIVLAAVALELAPQTALMIHKQGGVFTISMLLGFFSAIALLMVISRYFDADDDEHEKKDDDGVVKKEKEIEVFTSNPAIGSPATSFNLDIGSNKSTAYNSPASTPPRSPMQKDPSLDANSMPGQMGGDRWEQSPPAYNNNNNNWNNTNNNNNNWNNNQSRDRDNSFPTQIDHMRYGTIDNGRGTIDNGRDNASDVSASSYSNNSQSPLNRMGGDSSSSVSGTPRAPVGRNYNQGGYGNYNNNNGYGNNNNWNNNNNNWNNGNNLRAPYPPPPAPPAMPAPEGDWNGGNNNNWGNNTNNNWGNNNGNWGNNNGNMYNSNNWNTRTRQRGVSQHTWQPRVRYAAQWKNQGRSDMGYVPPPPPRRNQGGMGMNNNGNNQWGNNNNNGGNQWGNNNPDLTQTHTRMPSYMLHGMASTGLAKSMQRKSITQAVPTAFYNNSVNVDVSKPGTTATPVGPFSIPWGIIVAVAVDASTDGILIGVASAVGQGGLVVALALAIEMTFLGISTSIEMSDANVPKYLQIPLLIILPGFVLVGGAIGATVMAGVTGPLFVAFLSFGMAALLFLVTEELLIAAHEDLAHDTWYVSISFFVGFIIVLIMDQYSGPAMCGEKIATAVAPFQAVIQAAQPMCAGLVEPAVIE